MAALQYVDHGDYAAVILRRTYPQLAIAGGLIERSHEWLAGKAHWSEKHLRWTFPSGATLKFSHLQYESNKFDHQGAEYQFIGFDELTQFTEGQYRYLLSRLRRREGSKIPLRARSSSNPGGIGHDWVKRRFITEGLEKGRRFVPARLHDNPHIDRVQYAKALAELDPHTRRQLEEGDWDALASGEFFERGWFEYVRNAPPNASWVRYWDLASTKDGGDWTRGALVGLSNGIWYVKDMRGLQGGPAEVEQLIRQTAANDGRTVSIRMEQEPGSSGKTVIDHYARRVLVGFDFQGVRSTGSKIDRARPLAAAAENGNVRLVEGGDWITDFVDEFAIFPNGSHDDQVDAVSGAMAVLKDMPSFKAEVVQVRATAGLRYAR